VPRQAEAAPPPAPVPEPVRAETMKQIASNINDFLKSSSSNLQFMVDVDTKKVVVRVVDSETNQLIRQIPSEEMVAISKALDQMTGLLVKQTA